MKRLIIFYAVIMMALASCEAVYAADIRPALTDTFGNEGGYQCEHSDPGNWTGGVVGKGELRGTKFGIAANTYPNEDIRRLTIDRAAELYDRDFWLPLRMDVVKEQITANIVFDTAVNQGMGTVARRIQQAINLTNGNHLDLNVDGVIGRKTIEQLNGLSQGAFLVAFYGLSFERYHQIVEKNDRMMKYFLGWMERMKGNIIKAVHDGDRETGRIRFIPYASEVYPLSNDNRKALPQ